MPSTAGKWDTKHAYSSRTASCPCFLSPGTPTRNPACLPSPAWNPAFWANQVNHGKIVGGGGGGGCQVNHWSTKMVEVGGLKKEGGVQHAVF